ncbi:prolyl oligopeptidase family serine peptidase [Roseateles sp. SL47]|uniref:S9 family peptidase n=1 Tax=Roseateles sp. SL47 TaxID=2995138 RepID=UPI00226FB94B|nr:prolyl oligopeptidase family serine peptidase [Roseateles sp. SL47]WAC74664.1 prolyl oligopeptidase family serine peptidase [Roseateles sp. SL47]
MPLLPRSLRSLRSSRSPLRSALPPLPPRAFPWTQLLAVSLAFGSVPAGLHAATHTPAAPPQALKPVAAAVSAVPTSAARPLTYDVYAHWRSIQGTQLSRDGQWVAYALVAQEADGELVVRHLTDDREWRSPRGTAPVFSADGRYVAFAVQPTRAALDQAKKDKKKGDEAPKAGAAVMDLATGQVEVVERVKRFAWPKDGSQVLALLMEAAPARKDAAAKDPEAARTDDQEASGEAGAAAAAKKTPGTELVLLDVVTHRRHAIKDVADFAWSDDGRRLAYGVSVKDTPAARHKAGEATAAPASSAASSTVVPLLTDATAVAPGTDREGVYLLNPAQPQQVQALATGAGSYRQLKFDDKGEQLAFVSNRDAIAERAAAKAAEAKVARSAASGAASGGAADATSAATGKAAETKPGPTPYKLYLWRSGRADASALSAAAPAAPGSTSSSQAASADTATLLVSADTAGMPAGWSPSEHAPLSFSKDGQRLFLGTAETPKADPADAPEPVKVDLWHWKDPELQSAQKAKAEREKQRSYRAVVHLGATPDQSRFVQLARKDMPTIQLNDNATVALGLSDLPYRPLRSWEGEYTDAYAVDLRTGESRRVARKLRHMPSLSPAGRYILGFDAPHRRWVAWRTDTGAASVLTARIAARFDNDERDVPDLPEPYGVAGWTADDTSVVLYDRYDLWQVNPATGQSANLTQGWGRRQHVQLRAVALDPEDADKRPLSTDAWMLTGTNDQTRDSGYYRVAATGGQPEVLIQDQKMIGGLIKAKAADRIVFTQQTFREFPDLWTSRLDLRQPVRISQANPQQSQFVWGTQEQIEYTSADGRKLKALLTKPDNFDPSKKYPLMVYIYEKLSDNRYRYVPPAPSQNINVTRYVSNGYMVLRPDIVYTTGHPGQSAMNTVLPAIRQVVAQGHVDPRRIGIQGHSWGAYQINYLITHTTMFRAAEAGASMANMISGYGGIRWGAGISRAFQYEHGQSRIGATPWERPDLYVENSPIFRVDKVQTPYLTIHNDDDDAVPWYQGIEFFTALRRLGKEAYWFNYNGEKHGLKDRDHMKHYTVHMGEFFDHFLLGAPRPEWMDQPVPYLERGKRDVMGLFKPVEPGAAKATAATTAGAAASTKAD